MRLSWHKRRHDAALHSMDGVTQVVDVFAVVGGQEDGHAGGSFFQEEGTHFFHAGLIQAVEGLVQEQKLRLGFDSEGYVVAVLEK